MRVNINRLSLGLHSIAKILAPVLRGSEIDWATDYLGESVLNINKGKTGDVTGFKLD